MQIRHDVQSCAGNASEDTQCCRLRVNTHTHWITNLLTTLLRNLADGTVFATTRLRLLHSSRMFLWTSKWNTKRCSAVQFRKIVFCWSVKCARAICIHNCFCPADFPLLMCLLSQVTGTAIVRLFWESQSAPRALVPSSAFYFETHAGVLIFNSLLT